MQYKSIKGYNGVAQLGILLVFVGAGLILATIIQAIIAFQMVPASTSFVNLNLALQTAFKNPDNIGYIRLMQIMGTFSILFVPVIFYTIICNGKNMFWLGFNKYFSIKQIALGFAIIFTANMLAGPMQDLSEKVLSYYPSINTVAKNLENAYNDQVNMLSHLQGAADFFLALVIMAFLPALFEEMFFRGALQQLLSKWWKQPLAAIIVTSVIFSMIHMSIYLFLSRLVLGFALGWMYHATKNIWVNTIAHFLNNAMAVIQMYIMSGTKNKIDVSKLDPKIPWWLGVFSLLFLVYLFTALRKQSEHNKVRMEQKEQELLEEYQQ